MSAYKIVRSNMKTAIILSLILQSTYAHSDEGREPAAKTAQRKALTIQRNSLVLPKAVIEARKVVPRDLKAVKPPRSRQFYSSNSMEAKYEKLVDSEIKQLFKLSQQYKRSKTRGEIWLRLAERYVEKSRLLSFRAQDQYEAKLKEFELGKIKVRPKVDTGFADEYYKKAIALYEWFLRDFPKDDKVDQALYFLGYSHFELGHTKQGEEYYQRLVKEYPNSEYVSESYFALGEFNFENEKWAEALEHYSRVIKRRNSRLYTFALYKAAWCYFRLDKVEVALKTLERVIYISRTDKSSDEAGSRGVNKLRLGNEAMKDYVPFYAESGQYEGAERDFLKITRNQADAEKMMKMLAYNYADAGNREGAKFLFKELIKKNPLGESAAEYQSQIVSIYASSEDIKTIREEIFTWITEFGPDSSWAKANAKNQALVSEIYNKQELMLRNRTLQFHQTAQNSRAKFSQQEAENSYRLYLRHFSKSPQYTQMRFFYAELLYDMSKNVEASQQYSWYLQNAPKGEYFERAAINNVLALEKNLPSVATLEERRKTLTTPTQKLEFDEATKSFLDAGEFYLKNYPQGEKASEVRRMMGFLYYQHNQFDQAIVIFNDTIKKQKWSKDSQVAAELLLDTYKLREDIEGYRKTADALLEIPDVNKTEFGKEIRENLRKASFLEADKLSKTGKFADSGKAFEAFAVKNLATQSGQLAAYNAANNYYKAGEFASSIRTYKAFLNVNSTDKEILKLKVESRNNLANIFRNIGALPEAAQEFELFAKENAKDARAVAALYNAAVLWDALNEYDKALSAYTRFQAVAKPQDRHDVFFAIAEMYLRRQQYGVARNYYEKYMNGPATDPEKVVRSQFMMADTSRQMGQASLARDNYLKTYNIYMNLKKQGKAQGVRYAAEGKYRIASETLVEMKGVKLGQSEKTIMMGLKRLQELQKKLLKDMIEVLRLDYGPYVVAAVSSEAEAYDIISHAFYTSPVPKEYASSPEGSQQFKDLAKKEGDSFKSKALAIYSKAYEKATQLEAVSPFMLQALKGRSKLSPPPAVFEDERVSTELLMDGGGL